MDSLKITFVAVKVLVSAKDNIEVSVKSPGKSRVTTNYIESCSWRLVEMDTQFNLPKNYA